MISLAVSPTAVRRVRSTKTERCRRASDDTNGQVPTSFLATNDTGATADSTGMSSHDVWLATSSTGRSRTTAPSRCNADAEQAADLAVIPMREGARAAGAEAQQQGLHRHQRHGEGEEARQDGAAAQGTDAIWGAGRHAFFAGFARHAVELQAMADELEAELARDPLLQASISSLRNSMTRPVSTSMR